METGSDYYTAWAIYLFAVVAAHLVWWRMIRSIKNADIKRILHLILFAILITPTALEPGQNYWVPAVMAAAMDSLDNGLEAAIPRIRSILIVMLTLVSISMIGRVVVAKWLKKNAG